MDSKIEQLDLNLLKVFAAVYDLGSVTSAAKKLNMTQSGVSRALSRLKIQLDDPLFIRNGNNLEYTFRAKQLGKSIPELMHTISEHCFPTDYFEENNFDGVVNIAISGVLMEAISKPLTLNLLAKLPNAKIKILHWSKGTSQAIENGDIDIGINYFPMQMPKIIRQVAIVSDPGLVIARKGHPILKGDISFANIVNQPLAGMIIPELTDYQAIVEENFKQHGMSFTLRSDNLPLLFDTVQKTDLLLTSLRMPASTCPDSLTTIRPTNPPVFTSLSIALYSLHSQAKQALNQLLFNECKTVIQHCDETAKQRLKI